MAWHYFDDTSSLQFHAEEGPCATQQLINELYKCLGFPTKPSKHKVVAAAQDYLGVNLNLTSAADDL
eukprot:5290072-Amphidinium_carterae.1